ncbi:DsbA family protein [Pseudomonadales bacterium]|nr:DsbA family protein [Pseudomonadales bacterium]MDA8702323.1 DsbA family protein [Pseudomonadales bacterium]MDB2594926.1 DsbA family protein [Pseudomonadales bacterium]
MRLETRIRSFGMAVMASKGFLQFKRNSARLRRILSGQRSELHYFHQVDDPYSFLVVQHLQTLEADFSVPLRTHLVSCDDQAYQGDAQRFALWAYNDAKSIAPFYGETLPTSQNSESIEEIKLPSSEQTAIANKRLAPFADTPDFAEQALAISRSLWQGDKSSAPNGGTDSSATVLKKSNELLEKLGHYRGGAFYFEGEWFWGVDRISLLRARLSEEGFAKRQTKDGQQDHLALKALKVTANSASNVTLEYFPSLRSPYTAIGHQQLADLIQRSGVQLTLRPVMPMLMRGIPAPRAKQLYIIMDCAREARAKNIAFGNFVDPFGEPVKRAFALYPGALSLGRGTEFIGEYLAACFAQGIDIDSEDGLKTVVKKAGLDWHALHEEAAKYDWQSILEENLQTMLGAGLWGVPSFRVSGGNKEGSFSCWGQDRIWRVEHEIALRSANI